MLLLFYCVLVVTKNSEGYNNHFPCSKAIVYLYILLDSPSTLLIVDELTLVTVISLMVNSGKGNTESYLIDSGLSGAGTNGVSAFSGQYSSHFFYGRNMITKYSINL